ncbi:hypothetical protein ABWH97_00080 [Nitratireductor sp. ac15]
MSAKNKLERAFDTLSKRKGAMSDPITMSMFATKEDYWKARAEAAEKRLAEAEKVIAPFSDRYTELMEMPAAKYAAATDVEVSHLRAAAEFMEKGEPSQETSDEDDETLHLMSGGMASGKGDE